MFSHGVSHFTNSSSYLLHKTGLSLLLASKQSGISPLQLRPEVGSARILARSWTNKDSQPTFDEISFETRFINALVQAGRCHAHGAQKKNEYNRPNVRISRRNPQKQYTASYSTLKRNDTKMQYSQLAVQVQSREELINIVDYYSKPLPEEETPTPEHIRSSPIFAPSPPIFTTIDMVNDDHLGPLRSQIETLVTGNAPPDMDELYALYEQLPKPGFLYLTRKIGYYLLHWFSRVEYKSEASATRYLRLMDDARASRLPLGARDWASAISFAGRCVKEISTDQISHALEIFRDMESSGHAGGTAHFTTLFDIATKAGKFALADLIHAELTARDIPLNRYTRTALIYHHGLRRDGNGVRNAYHNLVAAGEIVDTVVINCVIAALLYCGEGHAAELVFARMKALCGATLPAPASNPDDQTQPGETNHENRKSVIPPPAPRTWRDRKSYGQALDRITAQLRTKAPEVHANYQNAVSIRPDLRTYKALIHFYSIRHGDFDRVTALLSELPQFGLPLHGSLFLYLFKAFAIHGGVRYTAWTRARLESVWARFWELAVASAAAERTRERDAAFALPLEALDDDIDAEAAAIYVSKPAVLLALKAFAQCAPRKRTYSVWTQIKEAPEVWRMEELDREEIDAQLSYLY